MEHRMKYGLILPAISLGLFSSCASRPVDRVDSVQVPKSETSRLPVGVRGGELREASVSELIVSAKQPQTNEIEFGRFFRIEDTLNEAPDVALISRSFWIERFSQENNVIGRGVHVAGQERVVIGVLPQDAPFARDVDLWLPKRDPSIKTIGLLQAVRGRVVQTSAIGAGLASIRLSIETLHSTPMIVAIEPGTLFRARSKKTQNMVSRSSKLVFMEPHRGAIELTVSAACANMNLKTPTSDDRFDVADDLTSDNMARLLSSKAFKSSAFRVQQFAIWTLTDNPGRGGYVGIGAIVGTGPSKTELESIKLLFAQAGLNPSRFQALR